MERLVDLHGTFILAMSVFNIIFAIVAALGNLLLIFALWKASSIPTVVRKLFLNLAISDHAVGIFPQLMYGIIRATMLNMAAEKENNSDILCSSRMLIVCYFFLFLLACSSFLTVSAIAVDRFLGIYLHMRYQELVTPKRVCLILVFLWFLSFGTAFLYISLSNLNRAVVAAMILFGSSVTSLAYIYIFKVVRYHRVHMHNQLRFSNSEARQTFREKKSLFTGFVVYIVFLVLRFPHFCVVILRLSPRFEASFLVVNHLTLFITLLNSSLNPVIYCWRYREIREKTKNIIRKLFGCQKNEMRELQFFKVKI